MKNINRKYLVILSALVVFSSCSTEDDLRDDIINNSPNPFAPPVDPTGSPGSAVLTKYVSVGSSITAGLMDGALYTQGQSNSYPNLLAQQFAYAEGGSFVQPDINATRGFNFLFNSLTNPFDATTAAFGRFILNASIPGPEPLVPGEALNLYTGPAVNNFGVPGARLVDVGVAGYGQFNPFYTRFAADPTSSAILNEALAAAPTFFTLWLGGNDILGYASSGGTTSAGTNPPPVPPDELVVGIGLTVPNTTNVEVAPGVFADVPLNQIPGITDYYQTKATANKSSLTPTELMDPSGITSPVVFEGAFTQVLGAMVQSGAKGVVMTIPDVTTVPIFNLIPVSLLKVPIDLGAVLPDPVAAALGLPSGATFSTALNIVYAQFGFANDPATGGLPTLQIFEASADNALVIETFDANGNRIFRQIKDTDKVLISIPQDKLAEGWGSLTGIVLDASGNIDLAATDLTALRPFPIPSQYIIDEDEVLALRTANAQYNAAIAAIAATMQVPVVDAYTILITAAVTGGIDVGNQFLIYDFGPNGFFSVDGVHPNSRGQGIITNAIIDAMATAYGSDIPKIDILSLPGVTLKP